MAAKLAIAFYENLAKGDSIKAAFESSARYVKATQDNGVIIFEEYQWGCEYWTGWKRSG
ncbi:hypothetical protein M23134_00292 [Microscilla marina ATCC 23134]|uniref:Uncharacterized protein n=1 Tax=Microscilla marina ATCC 23134 TaxID=313606 RepID=A1ZP59_MICM2|nr:hypothetical protein M23134_00292 [Microscilla marina ATCC 23134]